MSKGKALEEHVHTVYSMLLNMKDDGVIVSKNASLFSSDGIAHEVDVYYEFEKANVTHRVAIECKNTQRPIEKGRVQEFESKIRDLKNVTGVIVSASGYQKKAKEFAKIKGLLPLTLAELPSIMTLVGERIKTVALPDESYVGEPFWTIMELKDGKVTGSYYASFHPGVQAPLIPLVYSKIYAEQLMKEADLDPNKWAVRGLPRFALRAFILMLELFEMRGQGAMLGFKLPQSPVLEPMVWIPITRRQLIENYYGGHVPSVVDMEVNSN